MKRRSGRPAGHAGEIRPRAEARGRTRTIVAAETQTSSAIFNSKPNLGIATIANDKVYDWVVPFLESWRQTNAGTPLYVIPYDDNCERTRKACDVFGARFVKPDNVALDVLAKRLYPRYPHHRRRLRKFLSLALPLDEVIYVDVDIVLLRDLSCFFGLVEKDKLDFIVAAPTKEYVYNRRRKKYPFLKDKMLFNDGFFVTSNKILPIESFHEVIERDEAIFHDVRQRGMLFAQPLTNFVTHRKELIIEPIFRVLANASGESFYKARTVRFDPDGLPIDALGDRIFFAHWAGAVSLPRKRVFDKAWLAFADAGQRRMAATEDQIQSMIA
jgi:hypothetical protein